jgi:hypothetical protein
MTINGSELITLLEDEDERRQVRELIDDLACPPEDEHVELTDHSGISMV